MSKEEAGSGQEDVLSLLCVWHETSKYSARSAWEAEDLAATFAG